MAWGAGACACMTHAFCARRPRPPRRIAPAAARARRAAHPPRWARAGPQTRRTSGRSARADRQPWRRRPAAPARGCPRTSPRPPQCWSRSRQRRCRCWGGALRPETSPQRHADAAARARGAGGRGRGSGRAAPSNGGARPPRALAGLPCPKGSPRAAHGRALSRRRRRHRKSCVCGRLLPRPSPTVRKWSGADCSALRGRLSPDVTSSDTSSPAPC